MLVQEFSQPLCLFNGSRIAIEYILIKVCLRDRVFGQFANDGARDQRAGLHVFSGLGTNLRSISDGVPQDDARRYVFEAFIFLE